MGVPSFYKWLVDSFPLAVVDAVVPSPEAKLDPDSENPNGIDYDNLYLDMNGIIHPCFHPEGLPAPKTHEEVFQSVFKYIDKVFSIVRPRKLLYLAIDGVAPRAKMNQQRARRFRAAKDAAIEANQKEEFSGNISESQETSTCLEQSSKLDSNVITPGTEFMALLSSALQYYISLRMNEDPGWQGVKVILSDASVPGEGEHKIMSYIRSQRNLAGYDPNTRHCLYGLDADLIMLALATHEIHFSILREDVRRPSSFPKYGRDSSRRNRQEVVGVPELMEVVNESMDDYISKLNFQFLHIWILREYLEYAIKIPNQRKQADVERLVDDFVLICLFVGNDFLPHVPSLEISEGAIDLLMTVYKKEFVRMGYLTDSFEVNLNRMKHFLEAVGLHESSILRKRMQRKKERDALDRHFARIDGVRVTPIDGDSVKVQASKRSSSLSTDTEVDKIKYGEEGWKERYYAEKFEVETEDDRDKVRQDVVLKYTEGICWVMHYYYRGVCSWQWFYPYYYAPFASDFRGIEKLKIQYTLGTPFKPFDQLMAVLPAASAHALPVFYRKLMTETSSPLLAFYPRDFELDMNGKRFSWQAICKLPFIDESLLLSEIAKGENTLTDEERQRNQFGLDILFVHISQSLATEILSFYERNIGNPELPMAKVNWKIDARLSGGMNGYMYISDKPVQPEQIDSPIDGKEMIANNKVLSVFYANPSVPSSKRTIRPPANVTWPKKRICEKDIKPVAFLWHEQTAVVGRLHSEMPIPKSIYGPCLAKSARQLVLTWCLEMQQKGTGHQGLGEGASADGVLCCQNSDTGCLGNAGANGPAPIPCTLKTASAGYTAGHMSCSDAGDGKSTARKIIKRKRRTKQINGTELSDQSVGANGTALISNFQGTASVCDAGDDNYYNNGESDKQTVCVPDDNQGGDESILKVDQTESDKRSIAGGSGKQKWKIISNGHAAGLSCPVNLEKGTCADKTPCEKTRAADELRIQAVAVPDNNQGGDKSTRQLQLDQTVGDKSSINGGSGKRKKKQRWNKGNTIGPKEHEGPDGLSSHLNLEQGACADEPRAEKTIAVESSKQVISVLQNSKGREELMCQLQVDRTAGNKSSVHEGAGGLSCPMDLGKGICTEEAQDEKTIVVDSSKQAIGVPDGNQGEDEPTCGSHLDQTAGVKSSSDSGSGKRKRKRRRNKGNDIIPSKHEGNDGLPYHLNLEKGNRADGPQGENIITAESSKQGIGVPDNNQGREESTRDPQVDLTAGDKSLIREGTDGLSCTEAQEEKTRAVESSKQAFGVTDNNKGGDELACQLRMDQKAGGESTTDGGSRKRKRKRKHKQKKGNDIPIEQVGVMGLACCSDSIASICASGHEGDENKIGGKSLELKQEQDKGTVIPDNIIDGGRSTLSNPREAVDVNPIGSNGNCMDGHVVEDGVACHLNPNEITVVIEPVDDENSKSKKRRRKSKRGELPMIVDIDGNVIKPNDPDYCFEVLNNNEVMDSCAIQIS